MYRRQHNPASAVRERPRSPAHGEQRPAGHDLALCTALSTRVVACCWPAAVKTRVGADPQPLL